MDQSVDKQWPSPVGLFTGIGAVIVGQIFTLIYYFLLTKGALGKPVRIQAAKKGEDPAWSWLRILEHLSQPEGFLLLGGYLCGTWMFRLMPSSYYSFEGGVRWDHVAAQLLLTDFFQYLMHLLEHKLSPEIYKFSHKPHHVYTSPKLTDAFSGSPTDTILMILVPLFATAQLVHCNVWSYMAFGSLYANMLCLIHSEYIHPWEDAFHAVGLGTNTDHHVHHKLFVWNYGHTFTYWDRLFGTYKSPYEVSAFVGCKDR
jgi:sterol desaturase/sphingolipid hydroxylase (fatty acid hydroxylase superfamily)